MATYPTSPRADFVAWCQAHVDVFIAQAANVGLQPAMAAEFKAAVTDVLGADETQEVAKQAAKASTAAANLKLAALRKITSECVAAIKMYAETKDNPEVYTIAQILAPAVPSAMPAPGQPKDMTVTVAPGSGAITLRWKCTNPPGAAGTSYIVRRKLPGQAEWTFVGVTGKKTFTDTTFVAGPDTVLYTVQGQRSDKSGAVSDILTINFGAAGSGLVNPAAVMTYKMAA